VTGPGGHEVAGPMRASGAELKRDAGRVLVRDAGRTVVLALNDTAAALWELCDGSTSIDEMVTAICDVSSIPPSRARSDVERTLARFEQAGLITVSAPTSTNRLSR
jgi:hypothetical protein